MIEYFESIDDFLKRNRIENLKEIDLMGEIVAVKHSPIKFVMVSFYESDLCNLLPLNLLDVLSIDA